MQDRPTVLVPIRVLEGESIPEGVPELLANAHVVLLGYHVVPDQTATDQASTQFGDQATGRLDDYAEMLEDAGATVDAQVVFTHDGDQTINRTSDEHDCLAVLIPNATQPIENVLVAVRGIVGIDRFVRLISGLFAPGDGQGISARVRSALSSKQVRSPEVNITLYHVADEDETDEDVETLLDAVATRLAEEGVSEDAIDTQITRGGSPQEEIVETADDYDTVIMGESDPSVKTFLFGMRADQVAKQFLGPVIVIQHGEPVGDEDDQQDANEDRQSEADEETDTE
ncbi:universal stress protein [Halobacterium bonnevillei]|uniref:Universal stress protein n=1 Tax=Halobacterium bonnevillei TaxID=2692200 RepID=A0A6B0SUL5_9EURY|nr:universal stress protein [Halobacterium bonnevillei]MXR22490.1 universal stress protein [Halobacterium bonnevillei]